MASTTTQPSLAQVVVPFELSAIAQRVQQGERPTATVRTLLSWFSQKRRGYWVVKWVRDALEQLQLVTLPDFGGVWIDSEIAFLPKQLTGTLVKVPQPDGLSATGVVNDAPIASQSTRQAWPLASGTEANAKVGHLAAATRKPVRVSRDKPLAEATTLMLTHDYSQLPVMNDDRRVLGMVSWRSIGRALSLGKDPKFVRDAMDSQVRIVKRSDSFFGAVQEIVQHDAVLVRDETDAICGIVTAADISLEFQRLTEPFLLIGEIERMLRQIIGETFDPAVLESMKDPGDEKRKISSADNLTFGEYLRLLEDPKRWSQLEVPLDRNVVIERLRTVNELRNDVMHFDPDGLEEEDLETIRRTADFLQYLLS